MKYGWSIAVWRPTLTEFMHQFLTELIKSNERGVRILSDGSEREMYVGDIFIEAMKNGMKIDYEIFENGYTTDIGTHDDMKEYLKSTL